MTEPQGDDDAYIGAAAIDVITIDVVFDVADCLIFTLLPAMTTDAFDSLVGSSRSVLLI